jgi:hypothetical protein
LDSELVHAGIVHTDLTVTTEKLMELFAPVWNYDVISELGDEEYLELPSTETWKIYQNLTLRKEAFIDLYVHQHPCPTWSHVAGVLRSRMVNLPQQADLVENTYVKGTQNIVLCVVHVYVRTSLPHNSMKPIP